MLSIAKLILGFYLLYFGYDLRLFGFHSPKGLALLGFLLIVENGVAPILRWAWEPDDLDIKFSDFELVMMCWITVIALGIFIVWLFF